MGKTEIRPNYYSKGKLEAWDVIEIFELNFNTGNAFKYIARYGKKGTSNDAVSDLVKATTYLNRELKILQEQNNKEIFKYEILNKLWEVSKEALAKYYRIFIKRRV